MSKIYIIHDSQTAVGPRLAMNSFVIRQFLSTFFMVCSTHQKSLLLQRHAAFSQPPFAPHITRLLLKSRPVQVPYIYICKKNAPASQETHLSTIIWRKTTRIMAASMIFLWRHRRQDIVEPSWLGGGVPNQKRTHRLQLFHCILKYNAHERSQFLFEVLIFPFL